MSILAVMFGGAFALFRSRSRLMESGSLEERKEFVRAFIERVTVKPDESRLVVYMKELPTTAKAWPGAVSVGVVAGARFRREEGD